MESVTCVSRQQLEPDDIKPTRPNIAAWPLQSGQNSVGLPGNFSATFLQSIL